MFRMAGPIGMQRRLADHEGDDVLVVGADETTPFYNGAHGGAEPARS